MLPPTGSLLVLTHSRCLRKKEWNSVEERAWFPELQLSQGQGESFCWSPTIVPWYITTFKTLKKVLMPTLRKNRIWILYFKEDRVLFLFLFFLPSWFLPWFLSTLVNLEGRLWVGHVGTQRRGVGHAGTQRRGVGHAGTQRRLLLIECWDRSQPAHRIISPGCMQKESHSFWWSLGTSQFRSLRAEWRNS